MKLSKMFIKRIDSTIMLQCVLGDQQIRNTHPIRTKSKALRLKMYNLSPVDIDRISIDLFKQPNFFSFRASQICVGDRPGLSRIKRCR